jgi:hypothetical protein
MALGGRGPRRRSDVLVLCYRLLSMRRRRKAFDMALVQSLFDDLAEKYGMYSSWAIWNSANPPDTRIIAEHQSCLKTSVVMIGLNVSRPIPTPWRNFHGSDHARKLMFAFNNSPYRGAYMTDIIKGEVEANAGGLLARIRNGSIDVQKHINAFRAEMLDVGVHEHSLFILFGRSVAQFFTRHLARVYPNHVSCAHYSVYGKGYSDAEWVEKSWTILEAHCRATKVTFNTLEFSRSDLMCEQLQKLKDR